MRTNYADNQTYESESPERGRYQHVWGQICRPTAFYAGQDRNECRRIRRNTRICKDNLLQLGIRATNSASRNVARNCQSLWYSGANSDTKRIISDFFRKFSKKSPICGYPLLQYLHFGDIISPVMKNFGEPTILTLSGQTFCPATRPEVFHHRKQQRGAGFLR